jgi:cytidylate kinase
MAVVTISRQYGAGGLTVGPGVARALGFRFVDREVAEEAARRLGVDPSTADGRDERAPALVEELGMALASAPPPGLPPMSPIDVDAIDDHALAEAVRLVMVSLADAGGFVILGRGGQAALRGRPDACHLLLVADLEDRMDRIHHSQGVDERAARERCEQMDAQRAGYVRKYFGVDIRDPLLYHAVLNTSLLGAEGTVAAGTEVARGVLALD